MQYRVIPVTPFAQNCTLMWDEQTGQGAVVDPGGDLARIQSAIEKNDVKVEKILLTHGHVDHVGGAMELAEKLGIPIVGPHKEDQFWLEAVEESGSRYGFKGMRNVTPDQWLDDGETLQVGNTTLEVIHCPGHTPGHVVFYIPDDQLLIVGDVLFQGSIGRTDFPRGDHEALIRSIREKLFPLGDQVQFIPGHGADSTLGRERMTNPFVADHRG